MNGNRDLDGIITTWLEDGPATLPADTRRGIVVGLRTQNRARRMAFPGGIVMLRLSRFAAAAGIVLAVSIVGVIALSNRAGGTGGQPSAGSPASPAAVASVTPSVAPSLPAASPSTPGPSASAVSTADWLSFSSHIYGYDAKYPPYQTPTPATHQWTDADRDNWLGPGYDTFRGPVAITAMSVTLPTGTSRDAWIASAFGTSAFGSPDPGGCSHTPVDLQTTEVDGHPVAFWEEVVPSATSNCGGTFAFVQVGDKLFDFFIGLPGYEPTLEGFLSTVHFTG
jgi:hypothetical protein